MSNYDLILAGITVIENELKRLQSLMEDTNDRACWNTLATQRKELQEKLSTIMNDLIETI